MGNLHFNEVMRQLEQYMEFRGMGYELKERAKRFYIKKFPLKRLYDEKSILSGLPSGLRTEMLLEMNQKHITRL